MPSTWTAARARAVDLIAGADGTIVGIAVDHRDSLAIVLAKRGLSQPSTDEITRLKLRIASVLAPAASVVLLDAEYAAAQALAAHAVPGDTALVIPLEAQGYGDSGDLRLTSFLPGWTPSKAAALGAAGCKLLLPYRADVAAQRDPQRRIVSQAVEGCRAAGLALIVEPIVFARQDEKLSAERFAELVIEGAEQLAALEPEILKVQYPGSEAACASLDQACGSNVPWVLLGGGSEPEVLEQHIEHACRAGASGCVVGRTLFDASLVADDHASVRALQEVSLPMLERFAAIVRTHRRPWRDRVGEVPAPEFGWWQDQAA